MLDSVLNISFLSPSLFSFHPSISSFEQVLPVMDQLSSAAQILGRRILVVSVQEGDV